MKSSILFRGLTALSLLATILLLGHGADAPTEREKQIAELEKQLGELNRKLEDLKKVEAPKPLTLPDLLKWRSIKVSAISNNGRWFAYVVGPSEGESEVIIRSTQTEKEFKFPGGEGGSTLSFSYDSKWFAFSVSPRQPATNPPRPPAKSKVVLVNLANGEKIEFEGIRRFLFSGERATHLALLKTPPETTPAPPGSDLLLHELAAATDLNLGNVTEFNFDKSGDWLAMLIDSTGQVGNGAQIRDLKTGTLSVLDSAKAVYSGLSWTKKGDGLTCLKEVDGKAGEPKQASILAFIPKNGKWDKVSYDPASDATFPKGMVISRSSAVTFTEDLEGILFGIQDKPKTDTSAKKDVPPAKTEDPKKEPPKKEDSPKTAPTQAGAESEKAELVIWHWKDERLQSQQQVEAGTDRTATYLCEYRLKEKKFLRLADDTVRRVTPAPKQRWAIGIDRKPYQLMSTLDGRRYEDVYVIDLRTGERKIALTKCRWFNGPSVDGSHLLYYEDGHFFTYEMSTGKKFNITASCPASFIDTENDHNVVKPPTRSMGWSRDGQFVFLSDNWDIWQLPVHGEGSCQNLTGNGKKDGIRYQSILNFDPDERGYDRSKPLYVTMYGEWTKKSGYARIDPSASTVNVLKWVDAHLGNLRKAKSEETYLYTSETTGTYPDYCVAGPSLDNAKKITSAMPDQKKFAWSSGVKLIDYVSTSGEKLQAALILPANYQPGKKYPTIVYIYENLSQNMHRYFLPSASGFNPSHFTSNGYALLMPDIRYKVNDPGISAVGCVLPALEAAIKTEVVDPARVGLHGHSWGGYQTAFIITQCNAFKAAVAGAPLTDLVSMYSSIYWNSGSANQPIFESSQGRFTSGYWDNLEAFVRNSPIHHAKNVKTPLMLLHNDKDGAVDWNQGIEFFNTLRRLEKPVVMLQYKGENHGVVKAANRKDYTIRMKEFFDHYLMDKPAPDWLKEGIPHLKMEEHLKGR